MVFVISNELKEFLVLTNIIDAFGSGDLSYWIDDKDINSSEEAKALDDLKSSLSNMISDTKNKSQEIVNITCDAVDSTQKQKNISVMNTQYAGKFFIIMLLHYLNRDTTQKIECNR